MARREYVGNAAATTLNGSITAASATIVVTDASNWPTGSVGPFVVIIDRGEASEEKVLITSRSTNTLTVSSRGFDDTTAAIHADGATIEHGLSATDIDEVNDHVFDVTNDDHTQYLNTARHDVEARHTFTAGLGTPDAPENIGTSASAGSGDNPAREDHVHTFDGGFSDWDDYTPSNSNVTVDNGTQVARFCRIGNTVFWSYKLTFGSGTSFDGTVQIGMPVAGISGNPSMGHGLANDNSTPANNTYVLALSVASAVQPRPAGGTVLNASSPFTWDTGDILWMSGSYEVA